MIDEGIMPLLTNLDIDVFLFNFQSHPPSKILIKQLLQDPNANIIFNIIENGFAVDGIGFQSNLDSGAQQFRLSTVLLREVPETGGMP